VVRRRLGDPPMAGRRPQDHRHGHPPRQTQSRVHPS
jgi:hypothetical protein